MTLSRPWRSLLMRYGTAVREIAERQKAERWLLESEQRFRGYFEQGLVGMAILSAERDWIEVNQRVCQMLGYSEAELLNKTWADLVHPDDLPGEEAHFRQMLGGVVQGYVTDHRFLRKDGRILYASLSVQCMRKPDGAVDCILVLAQDISTFPKRNEIKSTANTTAQITI